MKDNSGSIKRNARKEKDAQPDYNGSAMIAGVEYWLAGWIKTGDDGRWLSLAFSVKEDRPKETKVDSGKRIDPDNEVPF